MRKEAGNIPSGFEHMIRPLMPRIIFAVSAVLVSIFLFARPVSAFVNDVRVTTAKGLAHYIIGYSYDLLGMNNRAVLEYQKAIEFDPKNYLGHLRLGTDYAQLGMLEEAKDSLGRVVTYKPDELQSHYLLALIYSTQKEYDKASAEYEYILRTLSRNDPRNSEIYAYLGQLYFSQRKYDDALRQFEKILELDPKNVDIMYVLATIYIEANQQDKAILVLKNGLEIDPQHDGCLNTLSYIYAEKGANLDSALELINRALVINPNNGAYLDTLGWVYFKKGEFSKALESLHKAGGEMADPVIYDHLGDVYFAMNNMDKAVEYWKLSLELQPDQEQIIEKINDVNGTRASAYPAPAH